MQAEEARLYLADYLQGPSEQEKVEKVINSG